MVEKSQKLKTVINLLKNGRTPGPQWTYIQLIKRETNKIILIKVFNKLHGKQLSQANKERTMDQMYQENRCEEDCSNYQGITATSPLGRLYVRIIKERLCKEYRLNRRNKTNWADHPLIIFSAYLQ